MFPGVALAEVVFAKEKGLTAVDAHAGRVAWSALVAERSASDSSRPVYRAQTRFRGETSRLPIKDRGVPFDIDLGPDRRGRTVAVYSRCNREPVGDFAQGLPPDRSTGRGCDIYRFDFATKKETRVEGVSSPGASEHLPTIWGRRIAFARIHERRRGIAGRLPHLYVHDLDSGRTRRLPGGTRGVYSEVVGGPGPGALDLQGQRLAVGWEYTTYDCPGVAKRDLELRAAEILLISLGGKRNRISRSCFGASFSSHELIGVFSPALSGSWLFYGDRRADGMHYVRYRLRSGLLQEAPANPYLRSVAADRSGLYISRTDGRGTTLISRIAPERFMR